MTIDRRVFLVGGATMALATALDVVRGGRIAPARAATGVVEDWREHQVGATGVPAGWRRYETPGGHPRYDFHVVERQGRKALELRGAGDHSTIAKEVTVDLNATPKLTWSWCVVTLPQGADLREKRTS